MVHCAQCGKDLAPAQVHRCPKCTLPYCRTHARSHECTPKSREELASWASSFEKGPEELRGELPTGATYRSVSGVALYAREISGSLFFWILGLAAITISIFELLPEYADVLTFGGIATSVLASVFIAKTFARMHTFSAFKSFVVFLVFAMIPILIAAINWV